MGAEVSQNKTGATVEEQALKQGEMLCIKLSAATDAAAAAAAAAVARVIIGVIRPVLLVADISRHLRPIA